MRQFIQLFLSFWLLSTNFVIAHEFWIEPHQYQVKSGKDVVADIRIGQKFGGSVFAYIPRKFERFEMFGGARTLQVKGRIGDRPALNVAGLEDGLWIVVHETTDNLLNYAKWEKFTGFVGHKQLENVLNRHKERGLPEAGFKERYRRFAKSLIAVGKGAGNDKNVGLRVEIIADLNPYVDDITQGFPITVLFEGQPRTGVQVEVFEKNDTGNVTIFTIQTDDKGRAVVPVIAGRAYILDNVTMLEQDATDPLKEPVWQSLWASLTFAIPD